MVCSSRFGCTSKGSPVSPFAVFFAVLRCPTNPWFPFDSAHKRLAAIHAAQRLAPGLTCVRFLLVAFNLSRDTKNDAVELLLKNGADPDVHDNGEGLTPLMWAAQLG